MGILSHELAHLLGMRHHDPHPTEPPSIWFGGADAESVMGGFVHPADLRFYERDVLWVRKFYNMRAGETIDGKTIRDVPVPKTYPGWVHTTRGGLRRTSVR